MKKTQQRNVIRRMIQMKCKLRVESVRRLMKSEEWYLQIMNGKAEP